MTRDIDSLKTQPREKAFYFFTSIGNYTGESASSMKEFVDKIKEVNEESLEFHLQRGDFQKWTAEVLQDQALADKIARLQKMNLPASDLRTQLASVVSKHLDVLVNKSSDRAFVTFPYRSTTPRQT